MKNLLLKNVLKEYKIDILKKKNLDKFNKSNDVFISLNDKYLNYEGNLYPRKFSKFCELRRLSTKFSGTYVISFQSIAIFFNVV